MDSEDSESSSSTISDEEEESDDEDGEFNVAIEPYQFEPEYSSNEEDHESERDPDPEDISEDEERTLSSDWCKCENCQAMDRREECVCCQEIDELTDKLSELGDQPSVHIPCITQHPGFIAVCLNETVLEVAWLQCKQYSKSYDGPKHKLNRHVVYRQFVRWCYGILGRDIRVPLPACAVCCIRAHFAPPGL